MTSPPPAAREVDASHCRWTCPRLWVRRATWRSAEPPGLWGQERATEALDRLTAAIERGGPRHLDIVRNHGLPTTAADIVAALERRGRTARRVSHPTEEALRGVGRPGILACSDVLVIDAADLAVEANRLGAVIEAVAHGTITELPGTDSAGASHASGTSIVLIGADVARKTLREHDPRFDGLWDERVGLRPDVARTPAGGAIVIALLQRTVEELGVGPVSLGAFAFLVELLAGRPARRDRVALDRSAPGAILLEARLRRGDGGRLRTTDVEAAWARLRWRGGILEEGHRARMALRQLSVATEGATAGVVNGLMIYGSGSAAYCIPGRITARAFVGRRGLVNIEREAKYSGRSFDKGVFQLGSWLSAAFSSPERPLGLSATIAFEQSYGKVDGDSATLAEAIALLSELSGQPCRQDLAITGALNQRGELLPVGSVNLKVSGWWRSCRDRGELTGTQGVLLPAASAADLQLDRDVLADITAGRFTVWTADSIEAATSLLLGSPWGEVAGAVRACLEAMSDRMFPPRKAAPAPKSPSGNGDGEGA